MKHALIGYGTQEESSYVTAVVPDTMTEEQLEDAILKAATGLRIEGCFPLEDLMNKKKFWANLKAEGITVIKHDIECTWYGWSHEPDGDDYASMLLRAIVRPPACPKCGERKHYFRSKCFTCQYLEEKAKEPEREE